MAAWVPNRASPARGGGERESAEANENQVCRETLMPDIGKKRFDQPNPTNGFAWRFEVTFIRHKMDEDGAKEKPTPCTPETAK